MGLNMRSQVYSTTFFDYQSAVRMVLSPILTVGIWNANKSMSGWMVALRMALD